MTVLRGCAAAGMAAHPKKFENYFDQNLVESYFMKRLLFKSTCPWKYVKNGKTVPEITRINFGFTLTKY